MKLEIIPYIVFLIFLNGFKVKILYYTIYYICFIFLFPKVLNLLLNKLYLKFKWQWRAGGRATGAP